MISSKIQNDFIEILVNDTGDIQEIIAGRFALEEFELSASIYTSCPFLIGTLDALPSDELYTTEGMILESKGREYNIDVELYKTNQDIAVLIHNKTNSYRYIQQLNQHRNDLFFIKRELSEKNKELLELRELADKANKEKSRFLAMMSHEVRNPLNSILGYVEMLSEEELSAKAKEYLNYLAMSGNSLKVIVNDILDISRIEAGKLEIVSEEMNLNAVLRNCYINYSNQRRNDNVVIQNNFSTKIPELLMGDSVRVTQIVSNLLSNAIKFTEQGSIVLSSELISESNKNAEVRFSVSDTGRGMSVEQTVKIFEEYQQTSVDDNRVFGGAGLGLSIVKRLVHAMNGSIAVDSSKGKGTTFSVDISFQKKKQPTVQHINKSLNSFKSMHGLRVLLADDDLLNQKITSHVLSKEAIQITLAGDGLEASQILHSKEFDLVILDINMPELSGEELITRKLSFQKNKDIPFLALTGNVSKNDRQKYDQLGFNDVISKPYHASELIEKIRLSLL